MLCILKRLDDALHATQALVLVPTRELAAQNAHVIAQMGAFTHTTVTSSCEAEAIANVRGRQITEMVKTYYLLGRQVWIEGCCEYHWDVVQVARAQNLVLYAFESCCSR